LREREQIWRDDCPGEVSSCTTPVFPPEITRAKETSLRFISFKENRIGPPILELGLAPVCALSGPLGGAGANLTDVRSKMERKSMWLGWVPFPLFLFGGKQALLSKPFHRAAGR